MREHLAGLLDQEFHALKAKHFRLVLGYDSAFLSVPDHVRFAFGDC